MRKWIKIRMEEVLVSSSSLVSGSYEASGVKSTWGEVSQESQPNKSMYQRAQDFEVLKG